MSTNTSDKYSTETGYRYSDNGDVQTPTHKYSASGVRGNASMPRGATLAYGRSRSIPRHIRSDFSEHQTPGTISVAERDDERGLVQRMQDRIAKLRLRGIE